MGIFSSDYKYHAFSQTTPLIEDEDKRDTLSTFAYSAFKNNENLPGNLIAATQAGLPGLVKKYLWYGKRKYHYGLPESTFTYSEINQAAIQAVIGSQYTIIAVNNPISNPYYQAYKHLQTLSWWDINKKEIDVTNRVFSFAGARAYLEPFNFSVQVNGFTGINPQLQITFPLKWKNISSGSLISFASKLTIVINYDRAANTYCLLVKYSLTSDINTSKPATLTPNDEWPPIQLGVFEYPSTEFPESPVKKLSSEFLPIAVFLRDNIGFWSNNDWIETLYGLLQKLNINAYEVYNAFEDAILNSGQKNVKSRDFFMGFFAPLKGTKSAAQEEYVYEFVKSLYAQNRYSEEDYANYLKEEAQWRKDKQNYLALGYYNLRNQQNEEGTNAGQRPTPGRPTPPMQRPSGPRPTPPMHRIYIQEAGPNAFHSIVRWTYMEKYTSFVSHAQARRQKISIFFGGTWVDGLDYLGGHKVYVSYYVRGLATHYLINTRDGLKAGKSEGPSWCPINYSVLRKMSFRNQERVLQDGLCTIVYTVVEEEIKWYQKSFWKAVIFIVTVAIVAFTWHVGVVGIANALTLGTTGFAFSIFSFVLKFTVGFLIQFTANVVLENPLLGQIISIFVTAGLSNAGFAGYFSEIWGKLGQADTLIAGLAEVGKIGNKLYKSYSSLRLEDELDTGDLTETEQEKQEVLEDAYLGTETEKYVDPHLQIARNLFFDNPESPDDFFGRTLDTNPAEKVLQMPTYFVDYMLRLPRNASEVMRSGSINRS
jgi:hypothetical protein